MTNASVYYPHGGTHFLAHYWTYNERGHIMLARTEDAILHMAKTIFAEANDAELKAYQEVEIVAPPPSFFVLRDQAEMEERISHFAIDIRCRLKDLLDAKKELPAPFLACAEYDPDEPEYHNGEYDIAYHFDCKNCKDRIITSMSDAEVFEKYGAEWEKLHPYKPPVRNKVVPSRAQTANDGEELNYVWPNFGHHQGGIELRKMDKDSFFLAQFVHSSALFFYRLIQEKDSSALKAILTAEAGQAKAKEKQHDQQWKIDQEKEDRERMEETLSFFKSMEPK
jgi:hypothetical protein